MKYLLFGRKARVSVFMGKAAYRNLLSLLMVAPLAFSASAWAQQEQEDDDIEEVYVYGIAGSLQRAADIKRFSNQVVDAVAAEDIGKLPDPNIADALQRVTGVQLTREDNAGREVSIRGLSSFYTKVTVNGVGVVPGAAADDSKGLDIGVLGADLATSLEVFKSPTASQVEGAVGGAVNINTARPLDLEKDTLITGRLRSNYEELEGSATPEGSLQLGKIFNDSFGVIVGFQGGEREYRRDAYQDDRGSGYREEGVNGGDGFHPDKSRARYNERKNDEYTLNTTLQWEVNDRLNFLFDATAAKKEKFRQFNHLEFDWHASFDHPEDTDEAPPGQPDNAEIPANEFSTTYPPTVGAGNTIVEATFDEVWLRARSSVREDTEELQLYNFAAEYEFSDRFRAAAATSYSQNTVDEITKGEATINVLVQEPLGYRLSGGDAGFSIVNPGGFNYNNPSVFRLSGGQEDSPGYPSSTYVGVPKQTYEFEDDVGGDWDLYDHEQTTVQLDFDYDVNGDFWQQAEYGWRWFEREETRARPAHEYTGGSGDEMPEELRAFYDNPASTPSDYGNLLDIDGFGPFIYPDAEAIYERANSMGLIGPDAVDTDRLFEDNYETSIDSWAAYFQMNFDGSLMGYPARGNFGARFVDTDFESTGVTILGDDRVLVTEDHNYSELLPSINVALDLSDNVVARAAVARVMKRPDPEYTRVAVGVADLEYNTDDTIDTSEDYEVQVGNPKLDPFVANQIDLSLEYYSDNGSAFSVGWFYKDVSDLTAFEVTEFNTPIDFDVRNARTGDIETISIEEQIAPANIDGTMEGFELAMQQVFTFLPSPFDGLGMQANYTHTEAEDADGRAISGTSEDVYNFILFYEKYNFGIRLAYNFRDSFLEADDRGEDVSVERGNETVERRGGRWTDETKRLDLSMFYNITDNFMVTVEGINITEEGKRSYLDNNPTRLNTYEVTGARWLAGVRFKF